MNASELAEATKFCIIKQARQDQITATLIEKFEANPEAPATLKAVLTDWEANGAPAAFDRCSKDVHDWLRVLSWWAVDTLALQALERALESATESEAAE